MDNSQLDFVEGADEVIVANRAYQQELRALMKRIHDAQERTNELQVLLKGADQQVSLAPVRTITTNQIGTPSLPWFHYMHGKDLPPNPDGRARDRYLTTIKWKPWPAAERDVLRSQIYEFIKRDMIERDIAAGREINPRAYPVDTVLAQPVELDWNQIAAGVPKRTATACRIRWQEHDQPGLARDKTWTTAESNRLLELAEANGNSNWAQIAYDLGTGRTAADCVKQYRHTTFAQHEFSAQDDQTLKELVAEHAMDWQKIGRLMGLAASQISYRYLNSLLPTKTRGQFSEKEDALLRAAVQNHGVKHWSKVATQVPGRTGSQCRDRWCDYLDPQLKPTHQWEEWEDQAIVRMKDEEKKSWSEISAALGEGRSDLHVTKRYKDLRRQSKRGRGQNFAGMAKEAKRKADELQREEERRRASAATGVVEVAGGEVGVGGQVAEGEGADHPMYVMQGLDEGVLPELPTGLGAGAVVAEADGGGEGAAEGETGQPAKKKARRVKAPAKKKKGDSVEAPSPGVGPV